MPTLTRWFLRAAIVNLVAALALALLMALPGFAAVAPAWRPVYVHLLVMGWATQMIFGVALWMFPRKRPLDLKTFDWLGWGCFAFTNLGLALRALAEPTLQAGQWAPAGTLVQVAAALQLAAILAFVVQAWPRVTAR
ncbi:MAG: hypothetical protein ACHQU1_01250 [Gemmatimonadales bacterium]